MSYLTDKFKGVYRLKVPIDKNTNDFPPVSPMVNMKI